MCDIFLDTGIIELPNIKRQRHLHRWQKQCAMDSMESLKDDTSTDCNKSALAHNYRVLSDMCSGVHGLTMKRKGGPK
jgi:hypothetical protein